MARISGWNTIRTASPVGHSQGSVYPAHLSPQLHPHVDDLRAMSAKVQSENSTPTLQPLLGPPGPPKGFEQEWTSVPTRQRYEDPQENAKQRRYMAKYGTLHPE